MASSEGFLRQRKPTSEIPDPTNGDASETEPRKEEIVWGKTPGGEGVRAYGHLVSDIQYIV
jgi:hypothetical protein